MFRQEEIIVSKIHHGASHYWQFAKVIKHLSSRRYRIQLLESKYEETREVDTGMGHFYTKVTPSDKEIEKPVLIDFDGVWKQKGPWGYPCFEKYYPEDIYENHYDNGD